MMGGRGLFLKWTNSHTNMMGKTHFPQCPTNPWGHQDPVTDKFMITKKWSILENKVKDLNLMNQTSSSSFSFSLKRNSSSHSMRDFLCSLVWWKNKQKVMSGYYASRDWTIMCKTELDGRIPMQKHTKIAEVASQIGR